MTQFERIEHTFLNSLQAEYELFVDQQTGARHIHLSTEDTNNAFMVAFPTRPTDSTGVAHVLEHTTLCGSKSYPVRDPFFMMLRRSLNTFMNAFTASDCTAYPFATQNRKDFNNLLSVYLDAVFFPLLDPLDFAQEGWRLDFDENESGLVYKGVVYNEMKGAMSAPSAQLWQALSANLFPDTIYRLNSGGEPLEITDLSYQQLQSFHKQHYHPSHAVFMTYGSFPAVEHQALIAAQVLSKFSQHEPHPKLPLQKQFVAPSKVRLPYEIGVDADKSRKTHLLWGWVLGKTASAQDSLEAQILSAVLLENSASPLRYFLETTDLADAPSELCGIDDSAQQLILAAGVEGSDEAHVETLHQEIFRVLESVAVNGVDEETLAGIIDGIEMAQRDIGSNSYPYGLQLMSRMLPACVYGAAPNALLDLESEIEALRDKTKDSSFIPSLVRKYLLDNPNRTRIVMWPDAEKGERDSQAEAQKLSGIEAKMDGEAKATLHRRINALNERQASEQDPNVLPTVTLADVPTQIPNVTGDITTVNGTQLHSYERPTNGLFYANLVYDISSLSADELQLLPLFSEFMLELGCGKSDYTDTQELRSRIGVFGSYASARNGVHSIDVLNGRLVISAKVLAKKTAAVLSNLAATLPGLRLDERQRLADLVVQERADAEASIVDRGHEIAIVSAAAGLTPSATLDDFWQGPTSILLAQQMEKSFTNKASNDDSGVEALCATFRAIQQKLLSLPPRLLCVGEKESLHNATLVAADLDFNKAGACESSKVAHPSLAELTAVKNNVGWLSSSQINFCARAHRAVAPGDPAVAPLLVLGKYLQDGFLHPAIRETGGAYGSGAQYDAESSTFRFFSYRDPRLAETFDDFERSIDWLANNNRADRLQESILGVIRQIDKPKTPAGSAISAFYDDQDNLGYEYQRSLREQVLATDYQDLTRVAERFLSDAGQISLVTDPSNRAAVEALQLTAAKLS